MGFSSIYDLLHPPLYQKGLGAGKIHFSEFPCKMDSLLILPVRDPSRKWEARIKGKGVAFLFSASGSASSIVARMVGKKTQNKKTPWALLRSTVLTMSGSGCDGAYHAAPATGLWARILVTTVAEQVRATSEEAQSLGFLQPEVTEASGQGCFPFYSSSPGSRSFLHILITL